MKSTTYDSLKMFKSTTHSVDILSRVVPIILVRTFTKFLVITADGLWDRLYEDSADLFNFNVNLGVAIRDNNFDYLDNIILPYFEACFSMQNGVKYTVIFDPTAKANFSNACNSFAGKLWDNILDTFCDELLVLTKSGKVNNRYLYGDN